jgi:hypothetical protein
MFQLRPIGDPPYLDLDQAHRDYAERHAVNAVPEELSAAGKPAWYLSIGPRGFRYTATFYSELGTPLRDVTWERDGERIVLRTTKDLFYPDGDPGRKVPYSQVTSVTREFATDGIVVVSVSSPDTPESSRQVGGIATENLAVPVPEFGEWDELLRRSAPAEVERFGAGAAAAAREYAASAPGVDAPNVAAVDAPEPTSGWLIPLTGRDVVRGIDAVVSGTGLPPEFQVITRGPARIIPLAVQADLASNRDAGEEVRRMRSLSNGIDMELDHREGRGIDLEFDANHWSDTVDAYVESLRAADVDAARYWGFKNNQTAVVIVWSGDEVDGTRKLALHVVPSSWVSDRYPGELSRVDLHWGVDRVQATEERDA